MGEKIQGRDPALHHGQLAGAVQRAANLVGIGACKVERIRRNFEHTVDFPAGRCDGADQLVDVDIADLAAGPSAGSSALKLQLGAAEPFAFSQVQLCIREAEVVAGLRHQLGHGKGQREFSAHRDDVLVVLSNQHVGERQFGRTTQGLINIAANCGLKSDRCFFTGSNEQVSELSAPKGQRNLRGSDGNGKRSIERQGISAERSGLPGEMNF